MAESNFGLLRQIDQFEEEDIVLANLGHLPSFSNLAIGRVFFINFETGKVMINFGNGKLVLGATNSVQLLLPAKKSIFNGGAKKIWHERD